MKNIFLLLILFISYASKAQEMSIVYILPEKIDSSIVSYINKNKLEKKLNFSYCQIYKLENDKYIMHLVEIYQDDHGRYLNNIMYNISLKSNRKLLLSNGINLKIILDYDLDFGYANTRNGVKGRKRLIVTNEGFLIVFDKNGLIYQQ